MHVPGHPAVPLSRRFALGPWSTKNQDPSYAIALSILQQRTSWKRPAGEGTGDVLLRSWCRSRDTTNSSTSGWTKNGGWRLHEASDFSGRASIMSTPRCQEGNSPAPWLKEEGRDRDLGAGLSAWEITCVLQLPHLLNEVIDASSCTWTSKCRVITSFSLYHLILQRDGIEIKHQDRSVGDNLSQQRWSKRRVYSCLCLQSLKDLSQILGQKKRGHLFIFHSLFLNDDQTGQEQNCSAVKTQTGSFKAPCFLPGPGAGARLGLRQRDEGMELQAQMSLSVCKPYSTSVAQNSSKVPLCTA